MTRQWLADPELMCAPHYLAEHAETHMFLRKMQKGYSLKGFYEGSMFFGAEYLLLRHDLIADNLLPNHNSDLFIPDKLILEYPFREPADNDYHESISALYERCPKCRTKMLNRIFPDLTQIAPGKELDGKGYFQSFAYRFHL